MTVATRAVHTGGAAQQTPGTWTPDGSPVTIDAGAGHRGFPGLVRLDSSRILLVYRSGTSHASADGVIAGRIGTVTGTSVSWASEFTIADDATRDTRFDDSMSVIDGKVIIAGRIYTGTTSIEPFLLVSDDLVADVTSSTTWSSHSISFSEGPNHNVPLRLIKWVIPTSCPVITMSLGHGKAGVLRNSSLTDWSSPTWVEITPSGQYTEVAVERLWGRYLLALIREESGSATHKATSTDGGVTWGSVTSAHDGYGLPMFRRLYDQTLLTVYRDSPNGDTAWRTSDDDGASWSSETILDTTGNQNTYASLLPFAHGDVLCVYSVENAGQTDGDLYSQVFSRS